MRRDLSPDLPLVSGDVVQLQQVILNLILNGSDAMAANRKLVSALTELATARDCTAAQLALAWLLDQGPDIVPIPGTRSVARLDENAAAARLQLSASERQAISRIVAGHTVAGLRYPEDNMALVNA